MVRTFTIAMLLLAGSPSIFPAQAQASDGDQLPTKIVSYRDLKLSSAEGVRALHRRVFGAVIAVCGTPVTRSLDEWADILACRRGAMQRAKVAETAAIDGETTFASRGTAGLQVAAR